MHQKFLIKLGRTSWWSKFARTLARQSISGKPYIRRISGRKFEPFRNLSDSVASSKISRASLSLRAHKSFRAFSGPAGIIFNYTARSKVKQAHGKASVALSKFWASAKGAGQTRKQPCSVLPPPRTTPFTYSSGGGGGGQGWHSSWRWTVHFSPCIIELALDESFSGGKKTRKFVVGDTGLKFSEDWSFAERNWREWWKVDFCSSTNSSLLCTTICV